MKSAIGCFVAFISVFYIIGFAILGSAIRSTWRSTVAAHWPTTQGSVTDLDLKEHPDSDATTYGVHVRYAYTVDGVAHEGSRLAFGYGASSGRRQHDEIYQKLKRAKTVSVRYNPANPKMSCLSYGMNNSIWFKLIFSMIWLGFCVGFTWIMWLFSGSDDVLLKNLLVQ